MAINLSDTQALVKECLRIIPTATAVDGELDLWIGTAISDMERIGIEIDLTSSLQKAAIINYVKGNFGMTDTNTKELCMRSYNLLITSLQLMV